MANTTPNPARRNAAQTVNIVRVKEGVRTEHENKGFVIDTYQCGAKDCGHKFTAYRRSVIGAGRRCEKCGARNVVPGSPAANLVLKGRTAKPKAAKAPAKKAAKPKAEKKPAKAPAAKKDAIAKRKATLAAKKAAKAETPAEAPSTPAETSPFA